MISKTRKRTVEFFALTAALAVLFLAVYSPHFSNPYPIHIDEWQHIAQIISASEGKANWNPYFGQKHFDIEFFFHAFWAPFALILGRQGFIMLYSFLPAVFSVLSGIALFFLVKNATGRFTDALFSVLIFASLKSNLNIMGLSYFTPLTMAIPLIFLFLLFFMRGVSENSRKNLLFAGLSISATFLIHPPSATILIPVIIIYPLISREFFLKNKKQIFMFLGLIALIIGASFFVKIWGKTAASLLSENLVFRLGWTGYEIKYFLPFLFSIPATLLAVFGIYRCFEKQKGKIFVVFALVTTGISMLFNLVEVSVLAPYQRVIYYALISLVPLSAIALSEIYEMFRAFLEKTGDKKSSAAIACSCAFIVLALIFFAEYSYSGQGKDYATPVISENSKNALIWISKNYPKNEIMMAPIFTTSAVYPISGNRVQSLLPAQLGTFDRQEERISDALLFYSSTNCSGQASILGKWNATIVLSESPLDCFGSPEYSSGYFVYSTNASS
jgi:hypothetical protein